MTTQQQVIGIAPEAVVRERILAIARGHYHPQPDEPKTWYTSLEAVPKAVLATDPKIMMLSNSYDKDFFAKRMSEKEARRVSQYAQAMVSPPPVPQSVPKRKVIFSTP